jgi:Protein of unknown function, DUF547
MQTILSRRRFGSVAVAATALLVAGVPAAFADTTTTFQKLTAGSTATIDHSDWNRMLQAHVKPDAAGLNRVAFGAFKKADHAKLKAYVAMLEKVDVVTLDKPEQFAFWVNLYNAKTVDVVLDKYPIKSIKEISLGGGLKTLITGGPWQAKITKVGGQSLSLDDIENLILRAIYKDPRVHYAVNCASVGCPNLASEAYTGGKLEMMLEAGARAFINSPRGISFADGKVKGSSIYDWFRGDFGGTEQAVLDHMRKYATPELAKKLATVTGFSSYDYDWALADVKA